jgi:hypothetical protein
MDRSAYYSVSEISVDDEIVEVVDKSKPLLIAITKMDADFNSFYRQKSTRFKLTTEFEPEDIKKSRDDSSLIKSVLLEEDKNAVSEVRKSEQIT